jgi:O-6-methylguanine DNA methyltransferase
MKPDLLREVLSLVRQIPRGRVSSYRAIACMLGNPSLSRVVGRNLGENPFPVIIPCHRVVKTDGSIGGFKYGVFRKKALLKSEGVSVRKDKVVDFKNIFFDDFTKTKLNTL